MTAHARLSASSAHRWMRCPASLTLEAGYPNMDSEFSAEGTAAHELASLALTENLDADAYIGRVIEVGARSFTVDLDMAGHVQTYIDTVRELASGHDLLVEQRVSYARFLDVDGGADGFGTSDAVIISADGKELTVADLKYGRGVRVDAEDNEQLLLYALGAYDTFGMLGDFERVHMVISQPRLGATSMWSCTVADLLAFAERAKEAAALASSGQATTLPDDKACRFCKAKADCPGLTSAVQQSVVGDFEVLAEAAISEAIGDLDKVFSLSLGRKMAMVELVEQWCKAVRARTESELFAGRKVDGFKLVEGRRGSRAWSDKDTAETTLKSMRLRDEDMYDFTLISPTTAEKLAKAGKIGPRQWPKLQALIGQSAGKPSVAPVSDKRSALQPSDDFTNLEASVGAEALA